MMIAMLATMLSIPSFAADTVVNHIADFDGSNPTPAANDAVTSVSVTVPEKFGI